MNSSQDVDYLKDEKNAAVPQTVLQQHSTGVTSYFPAVNPSLIKAGGGVKMLQ